MKVQLWITPLLASEQGSAHIFGALWAVWLHVKLFCSDPVKMPYILRGHLALVKISIWWWSSGEYKNEGNSRNDLKSLQLSKSSPWNIFDNVLYLESISGSWNFKESSCSRTGLELDAKGQATKHKNKRFLHALSSDAGTTSPWPCIVYSFILLSVYASSVIQGTCLSARLLPKC